MPRSAQYRKDLSNGWKMLHKVWNEKYEFKLEYAHNLINEILEKHQRPVVCWSGGKDSTVVLHMVRELVPNIPVIYVDSGVEFPDTSNFIESIANSWNLNMFFARPEKGEGFWDICKKFGWPIFGKEISSNVERAVRTGNIRSQMSELEKTLAKCNALISTRCSNFVREKPSKIAERALLADVKFIGLRASESMSRGRLWVDYGDYYYVKRYFRRREGIWKANPIGIWKEEDIWEYHKLHNLPYCSLYDKGYLRNGCWTCAMAVKYGQLQKLRIAYPNHFQYLITETEMGKELFRLKQVIMKSKNIPLPQINKLDKLLDEYPDFFDSI